MIGLLMYWLVVSLLMGISSLPIVSIWMRLLVPLMRARVTLLLWPALLIMAITCHTERGLNPPQNSNYSPITQCHFYSNTKLII